MNPPIAEPQLVRHRVEIATRTLALVLGIVACVWLLGQLTRVISVIVVALVLVGTLDPIVGWLARKGLRRGHALILVFFTVAITLAGVVLLVVPPLVSQAVHIIEGAPKMRAELVQSLDGRTWATPLVEAIQDLPLDHLAATAGSVMIGYSTKLLVAVGYGISTLFLAIYLLVDPSRSKGMLYTVVPRRHHIKVARILVELKVIVGGYMRGQLITSLAISVFVLIVLLVLGVDNPLAIALFAGLTDIIPFVGGYIASTPVVLAVLPHSTAAAIVVFILMLLYQEFESRILVPRVYGKVLRLHPAVVLVALLIGGSLAGILGALLALPIAAGVQMLIRELRVELPGALPASEEVLRRDDLAAEAYERMSEGATAADAGDIATSSVLLDRQTSTDSETISAKPEPPDREPPP
jgi:putative heme transporter